MQHLCRKTLELKTIASARLAKMSMFHFFATLQLLSRGADINRSVVKLLRYSLLIYLCVYIIPTTTTEAAVYCSKIWDAILTHPLFCHVKTADPCLSSYNIELFFSLSLRMPGILTTDAEPVAGSEREGEGVGERMGHEGKPKGAETASGAAKDVEVDGREREGSCGGCSSPDIGKQQV